MLDFIRHSAQSWGVKVLFGIIIVVFMFWGVGSITDGKGSSATLAKVNGKSILIKDFQKSYEQTLANRKQRDPNFDASKANPVEMKQQVLSRLVLDELLREEATRLGVVVSPGELRREIASLPAFQNKDKQFDPEFYRRVLQSQGFTTRAFEEDVRMSLVRQKITDYTALPAAVREEEARDLYRFAREEIKIESVLFKAETFGEAVTPTAEQIEAYYKEHQDQFVEQAQVQIEYVAFTPKALSKPSAVTEEEAMAYYNVNLERSYTQEERVKARHILFKLEPNADQVQIDTVKAQAQAVRERIAKGAPFEDMAKEYSIDATNATGGDLGWIQRGQVVEAFEKAAFAQEPGVVGEPVRSEYGWHLIRVDDHAKAGPVPFATVNASIRDIVAEDKAGAALTKLLDQAQERVIAGEELAAIARDLGLTLEKTDLLTKAKTSLDLHLEPRGQEALFSLAQGKTTDSPLPVQGGYMLAKVLVSKPLSLTPLEAAREVIVVQVKKIEGMKLALQKAQSVAEVAAKSGLPAEYAGQIKLSEAFSRQTPIPGLGQNTEMALALFDAATDAWLAKAYEVFDGAVVARQKERVAAPEQAWEQDKVQLKDLIARTRKNEYFEAYLRTLQEGAKIEIVNSKAME